MKLPNVPQALCAQSDPESWFMEDSSMTKENRQAVEICNRCPEQVPCLEFALRHIGDHGIWGGLTPMQRRVVRRQRRIVQDPMPASDFVSLRDGIAYV